MSLKTVWQLTVSLNVLPILPNVYTVSVFFVYRLNTLNTVLRLNKNSQHWHNVFVKVLSVKPAWKKISCWGNVLYYIGSLSCICLSNPFTLQDEEKAVPPASKKPGKGRPLLAREKSADSSSTSSSASAEKQRLEARKRLLAAKKAASFRQNSTTESTDSIEIYVPEAQTRLWERQRRWRTEGQIIGQLSVADIPGRRRGKLLQCKWATLNIEWWRWGVESSSSQWFGWGLIGASLTHSHSCGLVLIALKHLLIKTEHETLELLWTCRTKKTHLIWGCHWKPQLKNFVISSYYSLS